MRELPANRHFWVLRREKFAEVNVQFFREERERGSDPGKPGSLVAASGPQSKSGGFEYGESGG